MNAGGLKAGGTGSPLPGHTAITRLSISDFRNYDSLDQRFGPSAVVLYGPNGAGKTNLLEAISLLAPGRGLRRTVFTDLAREGGAGGWAVAAEALGAAGPVRLGTGLVAEEQSRPPSPSPRQCRIDGTGVKSAGAFSEHLRITWLTPAQDRLFTGPASDRRRFLDRLVATIDPAHGRTVQSFEHAMKERNALLENGTGDTTWLAATETQMAEAGVAMAAGRADAVTRLCVRLNARNDQSAFPLAKVALEGEIEARLRTASAIDVEDEYRAMLQSARPRDRAAGRALDGPHRSDILVTHGTTGTAAARCSTGEQKALLIAIILAETGLIADSFNGFAPILLLDEVAAHLDAVRRAALYEEIQASGAQAWLTGTDRSLFAELDGQATFANVAAGKLEIDS